MAGEGPTARGRIHAAGRARWSGFTPQAEGPCANVPRQVTCGGRLRKLDLTRARCAQQQHPPGTTQNRVGGLVGGRVINQCCARPRWRRVCMRCKGVMWGPCHARRPMPTVSHTACGSCTTTPHSATANCQQASRGCQGRAIISSPVRRPCVARRVCQCLGCQAAGHHPCVSTHIISRPQAAGVLHALLQCLQCLLCARRHLHHRIRTRLPAMRRRRCIIAGQATHRTAVN